ncbi:MAG: hypothetical protein JOY84_17570 [Curvibacter sp.]|nr:hypothetical protein [Curvibacter sp.]
MKYLKLIFGLLLIAILTACGGGGGSGGYNSNIPVASLYTTAPATLVLTTGVSQVYTIGGGYAPYAATSSNSAVLVAAVSGTSMTLGAIAAGSGTVSVVDSKGNAVSLTVTVVAPASVTNATPTVAVALTSASGTALSTPTSFLTGSSYLASATVLNASNAPIANQLVQFSTTIPTGATSALATIYPTSALTNSSGVATVQVVPLSTAGAASIVANSVVSGTTYTSSPASYQVVPSSVPAALSFVSATPTIIVVQGATAGQTNSNVVFKEVNAQGAGVSGQSVVLSLNQQSVSAGVTFFVNGAYTSSSQTLTTDASGQVTVTVASGKLPTPVLVTAASASNSSISATSVGLAVTNGRPTQLRSSIAANPVSVEASNGGTSIIQGVQSTITVLLSDRMGNPIPAGTIVNLITNYGQISGTCVVAIVNSASQCTAVWTSAASRPGDGWFTVLAYLDGEEDFIDENGSNQYVAGDPFYDEGEAYLPKDSKATAYNAATDQPILGGMTGNVACAVTNSVVIPYMIPNTCDGAWSSSVRVRLGVTMNWSTTHAVLTLVSNGTSGMVINVADDNNNSMPSNSVLAASLTCPSTVTNVPTVTISQGKTTDSLSPVNVGVFYSATLPSGSSCKVNFTVTTPAGNVTTGSFGTS